METLIRQVVLPRHPRLGRNVNHHSASRAYPVQPRRTDRLTTTRHESFIGVLDQLDIGRCTGTAGVAAIYRRPFVSGVVKPWYYRPTLDGATELYSDSTRDDPFPGVFVFPPPPGSGEDTGSDGLTIAKVLKRRGIISGYRWAFTLLQALAQIQDTPVITGLPWYNSMFDTTSDGHAGHIVVRPDSGMAGGHEICADELIVPGGALSAAEAESQLDRIWVGGPNSWGTSWGDEGRWYLTAREWALLLSQRGDVTAFVPNTEPAPEPTVPVVDEAAAGDALWASTRKWAGKPHLFSNKRAAAAVRRWAKATGRS